MNTRGIFASKGFVVRAVPGFVQLQLLIQSFLSDVRQNPNSPNCRAVLPSFEVTMLGGIVPSCSSAHWMIASASRLRLSLAVSS